MLGRIVGEGGRGFGVDREEHPSVNLGNVATRRRSKVSIEEYEGMLLLDLDDVGAGVRAGAGASAGQGHWWAVSGL